MTEALQHWVAHKTDQHISSVWFTRCCPANRAPYIWRKLKRLSENEGRKCRQVSARGHVRRAKRKAGSGWTRIWGGGWKGTDPHSAPRRPASLNIHPLAPLAPLVAADHPSLQRVAYPTTSHPSTCANLQPPTSTSNSLNMPLSWTRLPVARHVWKPTNRRKMPSVQPQPPSLLIFWLNLAPAACLINGWRYLLFF